MSVVLSRIDFDPQEIADKEEADLDREDAEQQKELKDFLDQEFDDADLFDGTFNLNQSHIYEENLSQNYPANGNQQNDIVPGHYDSGVHHSYSHTDKFSRNVIDDPYGEMFLVSQQRLPQNVASTQFNDYIDNITIPYKSDVPPPSSYLGVMTDHTSSNRNDAQLQILYQARGRKIEELQKKLELVDEETSKDKRILQHKLTLTTGERDGLKESNAQLQNLLQEHKRSIATLNDHIQRGQDENQRLTNQLDEFAEKLQLSETTIDSLEQQIKQMSETESLSRARTQHESMLASLRKKHEEEILSLKEKLDDVQQALAWKIEDNNRYREMLESNSMSSEIGMLRHRLSEEENKNVKLTDSLDQLQKNNTELKEQLQVFYSAQKKPLLFSSTPFHVENQLPGEKLEFHTPISRIGEPNETPFSQKLFQNISIKTPDEQQNMAGPVYEKKVQVHSSNLYNGTSSGIVSNDSCCNCQSIQATLNMKVNQHNELKEQYIREIERLKSENIAVKSNMTNMIKDLDNAKAKANEKQEEIMLQFVDDAKQKVREDLLQQYEQEKQKLHEKIDELNGEVLYTKDEYVKLCEEMKVIEETIRKDINDIKELEISELKLNLEQDYQEKLTKQERKLTSKYIEDLDKEKQKWLLDSEKYLHTDIDKAVSLAKVDWLKTFNDQKDVDLTKTVEETKRCYEKKILTTENDIVTLKHEFQECQKKFQEEIEAKNEKIGQLSIQLEKESANFELLKEKEEELKALKMQIAKLNDQKTGNENQIEDIGLETINDWCVKEKQWKLREEELTRIIEETRSQLKYALESSGDGSPEITKSVKHSSAMVESKIQYILQNKEQLWSIKELSYKREMDGLRKECNDLELKCTNLQKITVDLEKQHNSLQVEKLDQKNAFQKDIQELTEKLSRSEEAFFECKNDVAVQKAKVDGLEVEKLKLEKEMAEGLKTLMSDEKKKWEAESAKLQAELLKVESERLKNNLLADIQVQHESSFTQEVNMLKERHTLEIRELKQGFRDKLERIAQMKKNWMQEEEEKRIKLERSYQQQMHSRLSNLQVNHEKYAKDQQNVWETNMKRIQDEHNKLVTSLREELSLKSKTYEEDKVKLQKEVATVKKDIAAVTSEYEERINQLKELYACQNEQQSRDDISNRVLSPKIEVKSKDKRDDEMIEKMRQFYLETLHKINKDVAAHIATSRERAARNIKEAVRQERRVIASKRKGSHRTKPESREASFPNENLTMNNNDIIKRTNNLQNNDSARSDTLTTVRVPSTSSSSTTDRITHRDPVSKTVHDFGHHISPRDGVDDCGTRIFSYVKTSFEDRSRLKNFPL